MCKSEPHRPAHVTRTTTSSAPSTRGSGRSSTATDPSCARTTAFTPPGYAGQRLFRRMCTGRSLAAMRYMARPVLIPVAVLFLSAAAHAGEGYSKPPKEVLDVMHAPPPPRPFLGPTHDKLLLAHSVPLQPQSPAWPSRCCAWGGVRVNPRNGAPPRRPRPSPAWACAGSPTARRPRSALPAGARIGAPQWNATGTLAAFTNTTPSGVELWVLDATRRRARRAAVAEAQPDPRLGTCSGCRTRRRCW